MSKGGEKTLWDLALDHEKEKEGDESRPNEEAAVFFVGSKNSGKTSIILRFLDRDEAPKPTTALEYTYGRRPRGHNLAKDVGHIFELGGGTWLSKLMEIPLNPDTILHTALVIVLDLSLPNELWSTMEKLLAAARANVDAAIRGKAGQILEERRWDRVGQEHPDRDMIDPFPIPLLIIGSKYDIFQDFDPEKRKIICKTLRFMAHCNGATLQFFSVKQEALITRVRGLVSNCVFGTSVSKSVQFDHNKPLMVPAGLDSMQTIGTPPLGDDDIGMGNAKTPTDLWQRAYCSVFPQQNINNPATVEDPAKDIQYGEPLVDSMRAQKDEELERYRRLCERKAKEAERQAKSEGLVF